MAQTTIATNLLYAGEYFDTDTALGDTIALAQKAAYEAAGHIHFEDAYYRKDIASKAIV